MKPRKRFKAWCYSCDCAMVPGGYKCPHCGATMPLKQSRQADERRHSIYEKIAERKTKWIRKGW